MSLLSLLLILLFFFSSFCCCSSTARVIIGATYSGASQPLLSSAVSSVGLDSVWLRNPNPTNVHAFLYSNTSLVLTLPNRLVPNVATNRSAAFDWLSAVVLPFFPRVRITAVSVVGDQDESAFVVPAARNLRLALSDVGLRNVCVSVSFSFLSSVVSFFPPSAARFRHLSTVGPVLQFLAETGSPLAVALHPYHLFRAHAEIPLSFALFQEHPFNFRDDPISGVRHRSLYDVMVGAARSALAAAGHGGMPLVVAQTGWPAASADEAEAEANAAYAHLYLRGLVRHLRSGSGDATVAAVYVYELFDGGESPEDNRTWGILNPNLTSKFDLDFSRGGTLTSSLSWNCLLCFYLLLLL